MKTKNTYQHYLREAERVLESAAIRSEALHSLDVELETAELLVPVVGSFSAGKSSMLNSFIGRQVLPVGIRPETELAAELHFASDEHIEAIALDGSMQRFALDAFDQIWERAPDFRFLRVYIDSPALQRIEPLVLVDMPGFGSAAVSHNKAIGNYLSRGAHFIAAVSVEEGNITRSTESQLQDIVEMQRDISVVLTKANLKPESEVGDIAAYVAEQVNDLTGGAQPVHVIGSDAAAFERALAAIAPEQLFAKLFSSRLKALHFNLLENVNIALASLWRSADENQQALDELTAAAGSDSRLSSHAFRRLN
jgi:GTP-binding protein EngB required for normal cell division